MRSRARVARFVASPPAGDGLIDEDIGEFERRPGEPSSFDVVVEEGASVACADPTSGTADDLGVDRRRYDSSDEGGGT